MSAEQALQPEPAALEAVTISRDVQEFDLLIEDMEAELGEAWGDLNFAEAAEFLRQDDAARMSFVVVAVDAADEDDMGRIAALVRQAKRIGLQVILVADGLGPMVLHELLRAGADDFAPYPLPERALTEAVARVRSPRAGVSDAMRAMTDAAGVAPAPEAEQPAATPMRMTGGGDRESRVYAVQSVAGGAGASTIAVNLAWEVAGGGGRGDAPSVCLIDLGLQFGSVATYLDLSRKEAIYGVLTDTASMDEQAFRQALQTYEGKLDVFTAPSDLLPLDLIGPDDIKALIGLARKCFDVVVVDMPTTLSQWTDTVMSEADRFFMVSTLEVRSAQNAMRLLRLMRAEGIPMEGMAWLLNRAPGKSDMGAKGRIDKLATTLDIRFEAVLPDGGKAITDANDQAVPLAQSQARSAVRKEIVRLSERLAAAGAMVSGSGAKARKPIFGIKFG